METATHQNGDAATDPMPMPEQSWAGVLPPAASVHTQPEPVAELTQPTPAAPRRMPVKTMRIDFTTADYAGWWVELRTNPPAGAWLDLTEAISHIDVDETSPAAVAAGMSSMIDMIEMLIVAWNFVDDKGEEIPCTRAGAKQLPLDVIQMIYVEAMRGVAAVPLAPLSS